MGRLAAGFAAAWLAIAATAALAAPADDLKDAQKLYGQGKLQPALDKVEVFLKTSPEDPQGRFLKGLVLTEQKRTDDAIKVFQGLTEDYPELPEPYNNLAVLYASQGNYEKARAALELAIHTHPYVRDRAREPGRHLRRAREPRLRPRPAARQEQHHRAGEARDGEGPLQRAEGRLACAIGEVGAREGRDARQGGDAEARHPGAGRGRVTEPAKPAAPPAEIAKAEPKKPPVVASNTPSAPPKAAPAASRTRRRRRARQRLRREGAGHCRRRRLGQGLERQGREGLPRRRARLRRFELPAGETRATWEKQRTERIERPKSIEVEAKVLSAQVNGNEATVKIRQSYKSDTLKSHSTKTLTLEKSGDRWLIKQERVGG